MYYFIFFIYCILATFSFQLPIVPIFILRIHCFVQFNIYSYMYYINSLFMIFTDNKTNIAFLLYIFSVSLTRVLQAQKSKVAPNEVQIRYAEVAENHFTSGNLKCSLPFTPLMSPRHWYTQRLPFYHPDCLHRCSGGMVEL